MKISYTIMIKQDWDPTFGREISKCIDSGVLSNGKRTFVPDRFGIKIRRDSFEPISNSKSNTNYVVFFDDPTDTTLESALKKHGITLALARGCAFGAPSTPTDYYVPSSKQQYFADSFLFNVDNYFRNSPKFTLDDLSEMEHYCNEKLADIDDFAEAFLQAGEDANLARFVKTIASCIEQQKTTLSALIK